MDDVSNDRAAQSSSGFTSQEEAPEYTPRGGYTARMIMRPAVEADFAAVVALANTAYRGAQGWATETAYIGGLRLDEAQLRTDLAARPAACLLTFWNEAQDSLLGTVWLEPKPERGVWYLGLLTVTPELQDRGLGRALLAAAEDFVRERDGLRMRMTVVNVRETLIAWYQRRGYRLTGEVESFPYDDERFGHPLRSDLSFLILEKNLEASPPRAGS